MIKAVIIDDEELAIEVLKHTIADTLPEVQVVATFSDPRLGLRYLSMNDIDLLFLDIEMPGMTGFQLLQELIPIEFDVIFTTAYEGHGVKAVKYSALDYLLKPVDDLELVKAVKKHREKQNRKLSSEQLEVLFQNMNNQEEQRIALATKERIELVYPRDIIYCQADNNYTSVVLVEGKPRLLSKPLKEFDEILQGHNFFRSHQSYLVNMKHVTEYYRKEGGSLIMSNGKHVPIARSKRDELMHILSRVSRGLQ